MTSAQILRVELDPDAVTLTYLTIPDDLRRTGLHQIHQLTIPLDDGEYDDEVEAVHDALQALLADALEDFANLPAHDPQEQDNDDDDDDPDDADDEPSPDPGAPR